MSPALEVERFGASADGRPVRLYTARSAGGLVLRVMDYGASVVSLEVPDRAGRPANVNLGFDTLAGYLEEPPYFGATVGRFCNRIAGGRFQLDGHGYQLATNDGANHLHGGRRGFGRLLWDSEPWAAGHAAGARFRLHSPDGDEGYPGALEVTALYLLNDDDELVVELRARTDRATPVNLANHNYWNLGGAGGTILDHVLQIEADRYLPVDESLIPTGQLRPVAGTPMDFTRPVRIGARLGTPSVPAGYDHCYLLRGAGGELAPAARLVDPGSGRSLEVLTTQPALQFYSGNFLDGSPGVNGYPRWGGLCLETQHCPDSPNHPRFPSTVLRPGEEYRHTTVHRFRAE